MSSAPFQGCAQLTDTRLITINQSWIAPAVAARRARALLGLVIDKDQAAPSNP
ncbi:hypothetical protein [Pseudomonas helmanticensis]|uniref:hypothetical protein n=1 Tax=Pseudomonas helmanticensis TaxID=1471381 RepID=UPI0014170C3A|nr:hypothetical protein [Pseudomonas helmanticensis]